MHKASAKVQSSHSEEVHAPGCVSLHLQQGCVVNMLQMTKNPSHWPEQIVLLQFLGQYSREKEDTWNCMVSFCIKILNTKENVVFSVNSGSVSIPFLDNRFQLLP